MPVIAVDGPSAAGKGTIAKMLADHFGFGFLDTGSLYRSVAWLMLEAGYDPADEEAAEKTAFSLTKNNLYELNANPNIRLEKVGKAASVVSAIPKVRKALFEVQRNFAENPYFADKTPAKGAVLDGRDIGNNICPDAEVKLFITAETKIRAERRYKELLSKGFSVIYDDVLADMEARDLRDKSRAVNPMRPAEDAYIIDTSALDIDSVFAAALAYAKERIES
ncbi:MAG: (d)CMP kinase [Alphaproteobacteria bacterium]|nr:(d)CMP kinase [Alphaproteobacteria bacterium]